ncbi:hypothetical protein B0H17DRAFT_15530 [Mycena rosella]|uniref:Uncharacterized protein n=1 Tax=Mycena rosella TaxID=1033263 RepID=A0AAD7FBD2_MYCRO|nr:hypothetical protein B0H17DRAFT_15530 [Mycena rosella]
MHRTRARAGPHFLLGFGGGGGLGVEVCAGWPSGTVRQARHQQCPLHFARGSPSRALAPRTRVPSSRLVLPFVPPCLRSRSRLVCSVVEGARGRPRHTLAPVSSNPVMRRTRGVRGRLRGRRAGGSISFRCRLVHSVMDPTRVRGRGRATNAVVFPTSFLPVPFFRLSSILSWPGRASSEMEDVVSRGLELVSSSCSFSSLSFHFGPEARWRASAGSSRLLVSTRIVLVLLCSVLDPTRAVRRGGQGVSSSARSVLELVCSPFPLWIWRCGGWGVSCLRAWGEARWSRVVRRRHLCR